MAIFYKPQYKSAVAAGGMMYAGTKRTYSTLAPSNSYTTISKRKRRTGTRTSFRAKVQAMAPAKHYSTADNQTALVGATHNTIYTCNLTAGIAVGTTDNQRVGDSVRLCALKLNGLLSSNGAITASCQFRVIIGWSGEEYNLPATLGNGLTSGELFEGSTGAAWKNTGIINPKAFTVLDDRVYTLNNSISLVADIQEFAYTVPVPTDFHYQSIGSVFGKTRNLYMVVIGCTLNGVPGVTSAGSIACSTDLIYKQL